MVRVQVHDVLQATAVKPGEEGSTAAAEQVRDKPHRMILLKAEIDDRMLPIWVGEMEGDQIALYLKQEALARLMTYDLFKTLLELGQVGVEQATVARLVENTFYSDLHVRVGSTTVDVDCRPSDAINVALRIGAPIYVSEEVMAQAGKQLGEPWESEVEWASVIRG